MRHTPWIDHCAEALHEQAEYPTDLHIKHYIDVQSLARQSQLLFDEQLVLEPVPMWDRITEIVTKHQARVKYTMASLSINHNCKFASHNIL